MGISPVSAIIFTKGQTVILSIRSCLSLSSERFEYWQKALLQAMKTARAPTLRNKTLFFFSISNAMLGHIFCMYFLTPFVTVPRAPITTGIILTYRSIKYLKVTPSENFRKKLEPKSFPTILAPDLSLYCPSD